MKRLESNLLNMVLSLTLISLVAAGALGGIYMLTKEPIEKTNEANKLKAKTEVLPAFDNLAFDEPIAVEQDGYQMIIHQARNSDGKIVGAAVEASDKNGFNGIIRLMVGFDNDGIIQNYSVLEQAETPGLGANMVSWFKTDKNRQSIVNLNPEKDKLEVTKDGGDVDAITAATISSRAFLRAVQRAYNAYSQNAASASPDATSGATALAADSLALDSAAQVVDSVSAPVKQTESVDVKPSPAQVSAPAPVVPKTQSQAEAKPEAKKQVAESQPAQVSQPKQTQAAKPAPKADSVKQQASENTIVSEPQPQAQPESKAEEQPEQKQQTIDKVLEILGQQSDVQ